MKEFSSTAELMAHYRDVRSRRPPPVPRQAIPQVEVEPPPEPEPPRVVLPLRIMPVKRMAKIVCEHYRISLEELASDLRTKEVVGPRHVLCYACHVIAHQSYPKIGRQINRDHTTVLHGVLKIEKLIETDPNLAADIQLIAARYNEDQS